jgi:hypothetical protein
MRGGQRAAASVAGDLSFGDKPASPTGPLVTTAHPEENLWESASSAPPPHDPFEEFAILGTMGVGDDLESAFAAVGDLSFGDKRPADPDSRSPSDPAEPLALLPDKATTCPICFVDLKDTEALFAHLRQRPYCDSTKRGTSLTTCPVCLANFGDVEAVLSHMLQSAQCLCWATPSIEARREIKQRSAHCTLSDVKPIANKSSLAVAAEGGEAQRAPPPPPPRPPQPAPAPTPPAAEENRGPGAKAPSAFATLAAAGGVAIAAGVLGGVAAQAMMPNVRERYTLDADKSACQEPVEERVVEYQRKVPFHGFSNKHLFPNEPRYKRSEGDVALVSKEDLLPPAGWEWREREWAVVRGREANAAGTDAEGWMYAFTFGSAYSPSKGVTDCARRRIWRRTRVCVAAESPPPTPLPPPTETPWEESIASTRQNQGLPGLATDKTGCANGDATGGDDFLDALEEDDFLDALEEWVTAPQAQPGAPSCAAMHADLLGLDLSLGAGNEQAPPPAALLGALDKTPHTPHSQPHPLPPLAPTAAHASTSTIISIGTGCPLGLSSNEPGAVLPLLPAPSLAPSLASGAEANGADAKFVATCITLGSSCSSDLREFLGLDDDMEYVRLRKYPLVSMQAEWDQHGDPSDKANLAYILHGTACESDDMPPHVKESIANGQYHGGALAPGDYDRGHAGMQLEDFVNHDISRRANLRTFHVAALRMYTSCSFRKFNLYLRQGQKPHPFKMSVLILDEAIRKLRKVEAMTDPAGYASRKYLYRGMSDMRMDLEHFKRLGGNELALMSTSADMHVAMSYASQGQVGLVFRYNTIGQTRGVSISYLSLYPKEVEFLFPPLTNLTFDATYHVEELGGVTIVPVRPTWS